MDLEGYFDRHTGNLSGTRFDTESKQLKQRIRREAYGCVPPYPYRWDFDDDGTVDSAEQNLSYTYSYEKGGANIRCACPFFGRWL